MEPISRSRYGIVDSGKQSILCCHTFALPGSIKKYVLPSFSTQSNRSCTTSQHGTYPCSRNKQRQTLKHWQKVCSASLTKAKHWGASTQSAAGIKPGWNWTHATQKMTNDTSAHILQNRIPQMRLSTSNPLTLQGLNNLAWKVKDGHWNSNIAISHLRFQNHTTQSQQAQMLNLADRKWFQWIQTSETTNKCRGQHTRCNMSTM